MHCSCGQPLKRYIAGTPIEGETVSTWPVQLSDPSLPETEEAFKLEGLWAASISDAECFLRRQWSSGPVHDIVHPSRTTIMHGKHFSVAV